MKAQDSIRPFPARVPPLPGESLASLVRRTSEAMAYDGIGRVVGLLADRGRLPPHLNQIVPGSVFEYLGALLRQSVETLSSLTVHHFAPSLVLMPKDHQAASVCDSKTVLRYFSSSRPVCPTCLRQDKVPYERLLWSFRPVPICLKHGCILICRCPSCRRPLRWDRPDVSRCRCGQRLGDVESMAVSSYGLSLASKLHQSLLGDAQLFHGMSAAACFWWSERLAMAVQNTPGWLAEVGLLAGLKSQHHGDAIAWIAAAEILNEWPQRLEAFLDIFQQTDKHKTTSTGVGRRFGTLLRHAAKLEEMGYPAAAMAVRQYLVEHYAGGHLSGKICLFQKPTDRAALKQRPWIPQTVAAEMLGLRHGAVARLVQEGILEGRLHPAGQHGRSVGLILRDSVEMLKRELQEALDVQAAATRLGIGRHGVLDLIREGMLPRAVRMAKGWRIPRTSVIDLETAFRQLPAGMPQSHHWLSLRQATRLFGPTGLTLARLLELIQAQRVSARMADSGKRLNGVIVSHADLSALVPEIRTRHDQEHGYPVHTVGKVLYPGRPIKCSVVKKWISANLLKVRKSGRARIVPAEELERFRSQYCLAEEACRLLGITRSSLSRWEVDGRIRPVYGKRVTPGAGFSLYRRKDLVGLSRRRRRIA